MTELDQLGQEMGSRNGSSNAFFLEFLPRFLGAKASFIPAHSAKECVDCMVTIAKV